MSQSELRNSLKSNHQLHWYRIDKVLGQGGFGITYLAFDPNLQQHVAIKEYLPMELAVRDGDNSVYPASEANGERYRWGLDRFILEARTLAKFKHPAIVRVLSVFEDNNTAYMVMEYEHGESLQHVLDVRKTMTEEELIPILAPLLDGLELIHAAGFIHRDIKPANIYIREDASPVLLDFGSARQALGEQTKSITSIVSPGYAPFEQYYSKSDRQGPWTDIYSLAATMYRAISGVMPMDAIDRSEAILKAERDIFVSAGEIGEGRYSPEFMRALDHALNFSEKMRPQTIAEWRDELGLVSANSAPPSHRASMPVSKTRFDSAPMPDDEEATIVASAPMPSVRNDDAIRMPPRPVKLPPPATDDPAPAPRRTGLLVFAVVAFAVLAVALWLEFAPGDNGGAVSRYIDQVSSRIGGEDAGQLVARGDRALAAGQAYKPIEGSAIDYYRRAIGIAPDHQGARQGIMLVGARMHDAIDAALEAGELERAEDYLAVLRGLPGQGAVLVRLEEDFSNAQARQRADRVQQARIEEILSEAATDIAEGRIVTPAGDNALARYRAVQLLEPDNPAAARGIAAIESRLAEEFAGALAASDFALAEQRLTDLDNLHIDEDRMNGFEAELAETRAAHAADADRERRIADLLTQAAADVKANRLATPAAGNAVDRYREVLALDPENQDARAGLEDVGERYVALARSAAAKHREDDAREYLNRARSLGADPAALKSIETSLAAAVDKPKEQATQKTAARSLEEAKLRMIEEARQRQSDERQRQDEARLRAELVAEQAAAREAAAREKRIAQEAEAKRLFEIAQEESRARKQGLAPDQAALDRERRLAQEAEAKRLFELAQQESRAAKDAQASEQQIAEERSTLVVEFDGFDDQLEFYGLTRKDVRADIESRLNQLGYRTVLHHEANRSPHTRLFLVRFRANLNSASGVFSYAASLTLYDRVPVKANSVRESPARALWEKGTTGVAVQNELRRVRDEYVNTMRKFATEVGQAPGRL